MIHRLYISWIVSLYSVLVTDLLLYLYGQLKLKAMHGIVQFEVYLTCADLRMKGRRRNLAEELNKIKVIIPQSFVGFNDINNMAYEDLDCCSFSSTLKSFGS